MEFESDLANNLSLLRTELLLHSYKPKSLTTFIIHDPKTRKISKSAFRDRVVHHALCNIIEPLFETSFIYDSYANRIGKGTLKAILRLGYFSRKISRNYTQRAYALKADIYHYFDQVNQGLLLSIIQRKIKCPKTMWLIRRILANYSTAELQGMPLGNLTSQFFANIYLNELDMFIKYRLGIKYYLRYVDDFVILHESKEMLEKYKLQMQKFLQNKLALQLHPQKTRIISLSSGIGFLGMRIFFYHRLLQKKNISSFKRKWNTLQKNYLLNEASYDNLYDFLEGWCAYARQADTFRLRQKILSEFEIIFPGEISAKEVYRNVLVF
jgi:retron-type reverse transcriptase